MYEKQPIMVWRYYDAPEALQISTNGGDEDWLAEIPPSMIDDWIPWMDDGGSFGCCCVDTHEHPTKEGWVIKIGSHA